MDERAQSVHNPHDRFFKETFSHPETACDFFRTCLPARVAEALDWQSLELVPGTFIDERLTERHSDLLYSVRLRDRPLLVYCLFEHQRTVDPDMPFRLSRRSMRTPSSSGNSCIMRWRRGISGTRVPRQWNVGRLR